MPPLVMTAEDRTFLEFVAQATAANPFSERRAESDARILGKTWDGTQDWVSAPAIAAVDARVQRMVDAGATVRGQRGRERALLRTGLMFQLFHAYKQPLDAHIEAQLAAAECLPVPFAGACLERMRAVGFEREEALRSFATFFQLRRAFHFLQRGLVGRGPSMRRLRARLWNNLFTRDFLLYERILWNRLEDFSLLLLGETGVGKGAAAAAIGRSSFIPFDPHTGRFAQSFTETYLAPNLSQYAEALIESELFGHRRGAFTGAIADHAGLLARCKPNGTIFLDEIGDLSVPVQIKLLRVLQERVFSPVGSHETKRFAGRVLAATNRPLAELRAGDRFRDDFYYRLCSDAVEVPTLRERLAEEPAEFEELVRHILGRMVGGDIGELAGDTARALRACAPSGYAWPGNVRELEQAIRSVLLNGAFAPQSSAAEAGGGAADLAAAMAAGTLDAKALLARYCRLLHDRSGNYGEVARRTGLDRRTVRKYVLAGGWGEGRGGGQVARRGWAVAEASASRPGAQ